MRDKVKEGYENADYEGKYRDGREIRPEEKELFQKMFDLIGDNGEILDLGCGTGLPFDRHLIENSYSVTGIDIAEKHVKKAEENIPEMETVQGDFFDIDISEKSLDAIVSFYAIFHIPRSEHQKLFEKMNSWLKEDGVILITVGSSEMDNEKEEWEGSELIWSSYKPEKTENLLEESGFKILEKYEEDWRDEDHLWILARRK